MQSYIFFPKQPKFTHLYLYVSKKKVTLLPEEDLSEQLKKDSPRLEKQMKERIKDTQSKWQTITYIRDILLFRNIHLWVMKQERGTAGETSYDDFSGVFYGVAMSFDSFHTVKA